MEEVFLTLLAMSFAGSLAIAVVCLARLVLRRAPKAVSYALWAVVLFRLLCPLVPESPFGLMPDLQETVRTDYIAVIPVVPEAVPMPDIPDTNAANPDAETGTPGALMTTFRWRDIAWRIWLTGALVLGVVSLLSLLRLRRTLAEAVPVEAGVLLADHIPSPFVLGLFHPVIYLPCGLSEREKGYILLHERTHIRRLDHITRALAWLALCLHWFNPLVWLAFHLAGRDMELSCDEAVLRRMGEDIRPDYSQTLLRMSAVRCPGPLAFGGGDLKGRIRNVLRYRKPAPWVIAIALALAVCVIGVLATSRETREAPADWGAECWLDFYQTHELPWSESAAIQIPDYPDATFHWTPGQVSEGSFDHARPLFSGMPVWNVFFCDLTGDGLRELCATVSFGSGMIDNRVLVCDYSADALYTLEDRGEYDYVLSLEGGELRVTKSLYNGPVFSSGTLVITGMGRLEMMEDTLFPIGEAEPVEPAETTDAGAEAPGENPVTEVEAGTPTEAQVLAARERALRGMTEEQIKRLKLVVREANLWWEHMYMYDNVFQRLEDPDSLTWNYFGQTGEIQIAWAYDGSLDKETVCREEGLTEVRFYEKYGTPVATENEHDAYDFLAILDELMDAAKNPLLKSALGYLREETRLAVDRHAMEHANNEYRALHDLDYFLLRYGPGDVGPYVQDASTVSKYYGTLGAFYPEA